jgi:hypothetical protein
MINLIRKEKEHKEQLFFFVMIALGIILRLIWSSDMEWKDDEKDMYRMAQESVSSGAIPAAGMKSGGGIINPGLSVAPFAFFALFTNNPIAMNRMVQILNVLALCCFLFFILFSIKKQERDLWLSGLALAAVSPLAVLFSRKIWAQDILPIISFLIIFANYHRGKGWGVFLWGLTGAIIGQIHMSGFFFAGGLFVFTVMHDHFNGIRFKWTYWLAGSLLGSITLISWIVFMFQHPQKSEQSLLHILQFNFFINWFIDSLGINVYYTLREDFWAYLREPVLRGFPTYLSLLGHLFLVGVSLITLVKIVSLLKALFLKVRAGFTLSEIFVNISITRFYLYSLLLGLGVFMTLSSVTIYAHYLICAIPFQYIFLAKLFEGKKLLFRLIILAQLIVTLTFLIYIHTHGGAVNGNYGVAYRAQALN